MNFAQKVLNFFDDLEQHPEAPKGVEVLNPYNQKAVKEIIAIFYQKYYNDNNERYLLIGINPGRLGAGLTGIPFTDPLRLKSVCHIENNFDPKPELSSKFIYYLIDKMGGPKAFYDRFYFSSVSPLGFVKDGRNFNYYDMKVLQESWEPYMVENLKRQIQIGCKTSKAFVLGRGKNYKYLENLNKKHQLFDALIELPHPRWVMQYRLKRLDEFISEYCKVLA